MSPYRLWLFSVVFIIIAFMLLPVGAPIMYLIFFLYGAVFFWGVFDCKSQFFIKTFYRNRNEGAACCLTFDDGPDPKLTGDILDLLKAYGLKATFFVIGSKARQFPEIVRRAHEEGHCIACHDLTHIATSNFRFAGKMTKEISQAQTIIQSIIGAKPRLYRPPAGLTNPHLATALSRLSMDCIGFSARALDAGNRRLNAIKRIHGLAKPGAVVLLHDCLPLASYRDEILKQVTMLFKSMKQARISAIGLDDMFGIALYEAEKP